MSKNLTITLIILSIILLSSLLLHIQKSSMIIKVLIGIILGFLLYYDKLKPYRNQLYPTHDRVIGRIDRIINPIQKPLSHLPKINIGTKIQMESGMPVLITILIILLIVL